MKKIQTHSIFLIFYFFYITILRAIHFTKKNKKTAFTHFLNLYVRQLHTHDALRDLVALLQSKKSGKHLWRSVTFSKVASVCDLTKINTPPWVFFTFCKLYKWCQIAQNIHIYSFKDVFKTLSYLF